MLENWLKPVGAAALAQVEKLYQYQFGKNIDIYSNSISDLRQTQLALIGLDAKLADAVRAQLYALSFPWANITIYDLGNVRKNQTETVVPVLQELITAGIIPVLLGGKGFATPYIQYKSYRHLDFLLNFALLADRVPYSAESGWQTHPEFFINRIIAQPDCYLFNFSCLAYQSHFNDPKVLQWLDAQNFEYLRLGKLKNNLEEAEPVLRDADAIALDFAAIKKAEVPACPTASPNGLTSEEVCQVARYAGLNDKLTSFSIYNIDISTDANAQTAALAAQTIWYFIEGFASRKHDYPLRAGNFKEYIVSLKGSQHQLTFWKSTRSERWWVQVPSGSDEKKARHRLFPCAYSDYLAACDGDVSDRIELAYRRFV